MSCSWRTLLLPAAALILTGCSGQSTPAPVFVGHVVSHLDRDAGEAAARGIRLAVMEANKDPDKGAGRTVKVIHTDTLGKPAAFEAEAVRLVAVNRAAALLGGTAAEEVERLELARVPVVSPCGVLPRSASELVFCTGLAPARRGQVLARCAAEELKGRAATVIADERRDDYLQAAEAFARAFPAAVTKKDPKAAPPTFLRFGGEAQLPDVIRRVKEEKPPLVFFAGTTADLRRLRQELGGTIPVLFPGDEGSLRAAREQRELAGRVYAATAFAPDADVQRVREFVKQFKAAFDADPDVDAALAYDDARLLFDALRRAQDNLGGTRIAEELAKVKDFPGVIGPLSFGEDRRLRRPALVVRLEGGRAALVKQYGPDE